MCLTCCIKPTSMHDVLSIYTDIFIVVISIKTHALPGLMNSILSSVLVQMLYLPTLFNICVLKNVDTLGNMCNLRVSGRGFNQPLLHFQDLAIYTLDQSNGEYLEIRIYPPLE